MFAVVVVTRLGVVAGNCPLVSSPSEPDDEDAKRDIARALAGMTYGRDGAFFVYTFDGVNLVNPRRTEEIGRNLIDLTDPEGVPVVAGIIDKARNGDGFHRFRDFKPSPGEIAEKIVYAVPLSDWRWVMGTGVYIDDITAQVAASRAAEGAIGQNEVEILTRYLASIGYTFKALSMKYLLVGRQTGQFFGSLAMDAVESGFPVFNELLVMANDARPNNPSPATTKAKNMAYQIIFPHRLSI